MRLSPFFLIPLNKNLAEELIDRTTVAGLSCYDQMNNYKI